MSTLLKFSVGGMVCLLLSITLLAQDDTCPAIVEAALELAEQTCADTGRNQACYGNVVALATARAGADDFVFDGPGDRVNVADVASLQLGSMNIETGEWGISVLQVQANIPDTLPGQNVMFLAFGDVTINNAVEPLVEIPMTATAGVNVRARPTTNASNIVASLTNGQEVTATGQLADNSWVRITFDYDEGTTIDGWVSADFLMGDNSTLNVVEADDALYTSMQAFYLTTGIGEIGCQGVPESGLLIQTPAGVGQVEISINDVQIILGSTIYVQAFPGDGMRIYVIEGLVSVRANGVTQRVPAGSVSVIELDENGIASGTPQFPIPYDFDAVSLLDPVLGLMPEVVTVPPALAPDEVVDAVVAAEQEAAIASGAVARNGTYEFVVTETTPCNVSWMNSPTIGFIFSGRLEFQDGFLEDYVRPTPSGPPRLFNEVAPGVYVWQSSPDANGDVATQTMRVISSTRVESFTERSVYACTILEMGTWVGE